MTSMIFSGLEPCRLIQPGIAAAPPPIECQAGMPPRTPPTLRSAGLGAVAGRRTADAGAASQVTCRTVAVFLASAPSADLEVSAYALLPRGDWVR
jgi:hypothetical protein